MFADNESKRKKDILFELISKKGVQYSEDSLKYLASKYQCTKISREREKYKGFKPLSESKTLLKKIVEEKSDEKIYGQYLAKNQSLPIVKKSVHNIESINAGKISDFELEGNVIYMIGPSGVGKTTMAKAIENAVLKHPEKTMLVVNAGSIDSEVPLCTQLFKTIEKKSIGFENRKPTDFSGGIYTVEAEGAILDHILRWHEAVVIIDDYDKMKKMTLKEPGMNGFYMDPGMANSDDAVREDKTADEILKSIADSGKYRVSNIEIDCSKILFIVTTNESKEELEKNFGIDGTKGGGIQRINVIEFKDLTLEDCRKIVDEIIEKVKEDITDFSGSFKVLDFYIDNDSREKLAKFIYNDKTNQGRLKKIIRNELLSLFTENIGDEEGETFNVTYEENNGYGRLGEFKKEKYIGDSKCQMIKECLDGISISNADVNSDSLDELVSKSAECNAAVYYNNKCCNDATLVNIFYSNFRCKKISSFYDELNVYFNAHTAEILRKHKDLQKVVEFVITATKNKHITENEMLRKSFAENLLRQVLKLFYDQLCREQWRNNNIIKMSLINNKISVNFEKTIDNYEDDYEELIYELNTLKNIANKHVNEDKIFKTVKKEIYKLLAEL